MPETLIILLVILILSFQRNPLTNTLEICNALPPTKCLLLLIKIKDDPVFSLVYINCIIYRTMSNVIPIDISTILDASEPIFIQSIPLHIAVVVGQIIEFGELFMTVSDETGTIRNHIN